MRPLTTNSLFYKIDKSRLYTDLDVLVELKRLCKGQFFVDIQQIIDCVVIDLEVRTSDNKNALLLTLWVFDPLKKFF